jgi:hypothetical protein
MGKSKAKAKIKKFSTDPQVSAVGCGDRFVTFANNWCHDASNKSAFNAPFCLEHAEFVDFPKKFTKVNNAIIPGSVLDFNGVNDVAVLPNSYFQLQLEKTISMEIWCRDVDEGTSKEISLICCQSYQATGYFSLGITKNKALFVSLASGKLLFEVAMTADNVIRVGEWNHIAFTAKFGGSLQFYLNGEKLGKATKISAAGNTKLGTGTPEQNALVSVLQKTMGLSPINTPLTPFNNGARYFLQCQETLFLGGNGGCDAQFSGQLAEFRIWNNARSAAKIKANYSKRIKKQKYLVGYWPLDVSSVQKNTHYVVSNVKTNRGTWKELPAISATVTKSQLAPVRCKAYEKSKGLIYLFRQLHNNNLLIDVLQVGGPQLGGQLPNELLPVSGKTSSLINVGKLYQGWFTVCYSPVDKLWYVFNCGRQAAGSNNPDGISCFCFTELANGSFKLKYKTKTFFPMYLKADINFCTPPECVITGATAKKRPHIVLTVATKKEHKLLVLDIEVPQGGVIDLSVAFDELKGVQPDEVPEKNRWYGRLKGHTVERSKTTKAVLNANVECAIGRYTTSPSATKTEAAWLSLPINKNGSWSNWDGPKWCAPKGQYIRAGIAKGQTIAVVDNNTTLNYIDNGSWQKFGGGMVFSGVPSCGIWGPIQNIDAMCVGDSFFGNGHPVFWANDITNRFMYRAYNGSGWDNMLSTHLSFPGGNLKQIFSPMSGPGYLYALGQNGDLWSCKSSSPLKFSKETWFNPLQPMKTIELGHDKWGELNVWGVDLKGRLWFCHSKTGKWVGPNWNGAPTGLVDVVAVPGSGSGSIVWVLDNKGAIHCVYQTNAQGTWSKWRKNWQNQKFDAIKLVKGSRVQDIEFTGMHFANDDPSYQLMVLGTKSQVWNIEQEFTGSAWQAEEQFMLSWEGFKGEEALYSGIRVVMRGCQGDGDFNFKPITYVNGVWQNQGAKTVGTWNEVFELWKLNAAGQIELGPINSGDKVFVYNAAERKHVHRNIGGSLLPPTHVSNHWTIDMPTVKTEVEGVDIGAYNRGSEPLEDATMPLISPKTSKQRVWGGLLGFAKTLSCPALYLDDKKNVVLGFRGNGEPLQMSGGYASFDIEVEDINDNYYQEGSLAQATMTEGGFFQVQYKLGTAKTKGKWSHLGKVSLLEDFEYPLPPKGLVWSVPPPFKVTGLPSVLLRLVNYQNAHPKLGTLNLLQFAVDMLENMTGLGTFNEGIYKPFLTVPIDQNKITKTYDTVKKRIQGNLNKWIPVPPWVTPKVKKGNPNAVPQAEVNYFMLANQMFALSISENKLWTKKVKVKKAKKQYKKYVESEWFANTIRQYTDDVIGVEFKETLNRFSSFGGPQMAMAGFLKSQQFLEYLSRLDPITQGKILKTELSTLAYLDPVVAAATSQSITAYLMAKQAFESPTELMSSLSAATQKKVLMDIFNAAINSGEGQLAETLLVLDVTSQTLVDDAATWLLKYLYNPGVKAIKQERMERVIQANVWFQTVSQAKYGIHVNGKLWDRNQQELDAVFEIYNKELRSGNIEVGDTVAGKGFHVAIAALAIYSMVKSEYKTPKEQMAFAASVMALVSSSNDVMGAFSFIGKAFKLEMTGLYENGRRIIEVRSFINQKKISGGKATKAVLLAMEKTGKNMKMAFKTMKLIPVIDAMAEVITLGLAIADLIETAEDPTSDDWDIPIAAANVAAGTGGLVAAGAALMGAAIAGPLALVVLVVVVGVAATECAHSKNHASMKRDKWIDSTLKRILLHS